jgi:hypothetical protein
MKQTSYNKYKNVRVGKYDSKKESRRAEMLKLLQEKRIIHNLKEHPRYDIKIGGLHICTYVGDFEYIDSDGIKIVEDIKGMRTGLAYRLFCIKRSLMKAVNGIDIVEVI